MTTESRLVAYAPNGAKMGPLPTPISSSLSLPLNDVGALTFTYAPDGPMADFLGAPIEVAVEVSTDSGLTWAEPRNGRYLYLQDGRDPIEDDNWSVSCPGIGRRLDWARVPLAGLNSSGQREFVDRNPGFILGTLVAEAQARGALQGMGSSLLESGDSAGTPWPATYTVAYAPGTSLKAVLQAMADNGWLDYRFNGRDLEVYVPETVMGVDRTVGADPIVLRAGRDVSQGPFRRTWEGIADVAWVQGDSLAWVERSNPAAVRPWGRMETFVQASGVTDSGTLAVVGDRTLDQAADFRAEWTFTILRDSAITPLGSYAPGDWVFIAPDGQQPQRMRVRQVTLTQNGEDTGANIVANDRFLEADIRTARDVQKILNTGTNATSGTVSSPVGADILRPATPTGLNGTSSAYVDDLGRTRATITVDWPDVVTNIDGTTATDVQFYEVWRRRQGESTWFLLGEFDQSVYQGSDYEPADTWEFRVRAVDNVFNRSEFSVTEAVLTAQDTDAPPKPSQPLLDTVDGVLQAIWDGETDAGNPYATPDLKWLEVHVSAENDFVPTQGASGTGSTWKAVIEGGSGFAYRALVEGLPRGITHYVKFVPVDTSLNVGDASDQAAIVVDIPTDGQAPDAPVGWEPTLEPLGVGALIVRWDPIPNQDAISYRVWVDTQTPVRKDAAHYVGEGADNAAVMLLNGVPLEPETDYYAAVEPYDPDGAAPTVEAPDPAQVRQAGQDLISATYVYAGKISASQIESGQLSASIALLGSIATASSGRNITMSSADGLKGLDSLGNVVFSFPTDTTQGATLQAALTANSIDAVGKVSMRAADNEVRAGAKIVLQKGSTPPTAAPTVVNEWGMVRASDMFGAASVPAAYARGGSYDPASDRYYSAFTNQTDSGQYGGFGILEYDAAGNQTWGLWIADGSTYAGQIAGVARIGNTIYALCHFNIYPGASYDMAYAFWLRWDATTKARLADVKCNFGVPFGSGYSLAQFTVGADHVNGRLLVLGLDNGNGYTATVKAYNPADLNTAASTVALAGSWDPGSNNICPVQSVSYDTDDTGAARFCVSARYQSSQTYLFNSGGGRVSAEEFPTPEAPAWTVWNADLAQYVTASRTSGRLYKHDGINWTTGTPTETWEASYTWYDGDTVNGTHETPQSPVASYTQSKRAKITLTAPPIPDNGGVDDPDRVRFYLGYNAGARTDQWLQVTTAAGVRTATRSTVTFSGTNPPATSNFPDGTPGSIESSDGTAVLKGDGTLKVKSLETPPAGQVYPGQHFQRDWVTVMARRFTSLASGFNDTVFGPQGILIPSGARAFAMTATVMARSGGNAAGNWNAHLAMPGGGYVQIQDRRMHNETDQFCDFAMTLPLFGGITPAQQGGTMTLAINAQVDAGGSGWGVKYGQLSVDWFR